MPKNHLRSFAVFILLLCTLLYSSRIRGWAQDAVPVDLIEELKLFSKALSTIQYAYVEDLKPRERLYQAIKGMLSDLDPFSEFIPPERFNFFEEHIKGEFGGVGIMVQLKDGQPVVTEVLKNSPAEAAGILTEDILLKVDGKEIKGKNPIEIASLIRGEIGTTVILNLRRPSTSAEWDQPVKRQKFEMEAIKDVRIVGKAVGYLRIEDFQEHTIEQLDRALAELDKKGMKALIIDLRNNGGGLLPMGVGLAERFLPEGKLIVSVKSKVPEQQKDYVSSGKFVWEKLELVVLVNGNSASASEVFSAAIQDHERGTVIGVKTFGKASVQSVIPLDEHSAMKLTTARYLTPKGRVIDKIGVIPDKVVENGPPGTPHADFQTAAALEHFKKWL